MNNLDKYISLAREIVKSYNEIVNLLIKEQIPIDDCNLVIDKIKNLKNKEKNLYSNISNTDLYRNSRILKENYNNNDSKIIRILYRCLINFEKKEENGIIDEYGIKDIFRSKILIDTFKLVINKIMNIKINDDKSKNFVTLLLDKNLEFLINKLSIYEVSEDLLIKYNFDVQDIPDINLSSININDSNGLRIQFREIAYGEIINCINKFKLMKSEEEIDIIYENLFNITYLEQLFNYLTLDQVKHLSLYYLNKKIDDKLIDSSVRRLIRNKINEK